MSEQASRPVLDSLSVSTEGCPAASVPGLTETRIMAVGARLAPVLAHAVAVVVPSTAGVAGVAAADRAAGDTAAADKALGAEGKPAVAGRVPGAPAPQAGSLGKAARAARSPEPLGLLRHAAALRPSRAACSRHAGDTRRRARGSAWPTATPVPRFHRTRRRRAPPSRALRILASRSDGRRRSAGSRSRARRAPRTSASL